MSNFIGYLLLITIVSFCIGLIFLASTIQPNLCAKYDIEYGYVTEYVGSPDYNCYIIMEDGTKVLVHDFHISDYKKPLKRSNDQITGTH